MNGLIQFFKELQIENKVEKIESFGSGLVNNTWLVSLQNKKIIVQKINTNIFKYPENIDHNLNTLANYFSKYFPEYIFTKPLSNLFGKTLFKINNEYYRGYEYIEDSKVYNIIENENLAFEAAKQFGKFTKQCADINIHEIKETIADFHNIQLRYQQFEYAITDAIPEKKAISKDLIQTLFQKKYIIQNYNSIINNKKIKLRVIHHDTKINNVLFNNKNKGICIIDLDTIMPGYYISDVGDMMRTYLSPVDENEIDLEKIIIRENYFKAITSGYLEEMNDYLGKEELSEFIFSGQFMIYMQALRFLTDYLQNNIYYGAKYPLENLNRAKNQITLLEKYEEKITDFKNIISKNNF